MSDTYTLPRLANGPVGVSLPTVTVTRQSDGATLSGDSWVSPQPVQRTRRVAILGFAETVRDAPVADPSWELWAMNGFHRAAKPDFGIDVPEERYALWFDMHRIDYTRAYGKVAKIEGQQEEWLRKPHPFPIMSVETSPEWPSVVPYPIDQVIQTMGREYFTSSVSYALAYALAQPDVAEVGFWGIDLAHDSEYADQRPCAEYWIGRADAMGIKVTIHERSALLKQFHRYGYEEGDPLANDLLGGLQKQAVDLEKRIADLQAVQERNVSEIHANDGALQLTKTLIQRLQHYQRGGRI